MFHAAASLTYIPNTQADLTVNMVTGYVFNIDNGYYYLNLLGCPFVTFLQNTSSTVLTGTTITPADIYAGRLHICSSVLKSCTILYKYDQIPLLPISKLRY